MNGALRLLCSGVLGMGLASVAGCESASYGVGVSYGSGYYPGYYPGYPGYWYDDNRPIVIAPPENRPERPTTLPASVPSTRPSIPSSRPPASTRPAPTMSRPPPRPMPQRRR
ncbi:MAG TPA: hypothetical protein VIH25_02935 [Steroidobacteraceae bacterium]